MWQKNKTKLFLVILITSILIFGFGCKEKSNQDTSSNQVSKNALQNYVEVPLDKAKDLSKKTEERNEKINKALED